MKRLIVWISRLIIYRLARRLKDQELLLERHQRELELIEYRLDCLRKAEKAEWN